jgi:hypothetical protein
MTYAVTSSATALMLRLSRKNIIRPRAPSRRFPRLRLRLLLAARDERSHAESGGDNERRALVAFGLSRLDGLAQ